MKISELSRQAGIPLATTKFYLREKLVPPGRATAPTQAQYDGSHLARLRLARALVQVGGLSVAAAREVLGVLDRHVGSLHQLLGVVHASLPPSVSPELSTARASRVVDELQWAVQPSSPALRQLEQALTTLDEVGAPARHDALITYARLVRQIAELEVGSIPRGSAEEAATAAVVGTILWEPVLLALRRLAQEEVSAQTLDS